LSSRWANWSRSLEAGLSFLDATVSEALELTVNTSGNLTETVKITLKEVALVEDLTLKCSGHLIVQIIKAIRG
jgi:hypothetical protein